MSKRVVCSSADECCEDEEDESIGRTGAEDEDHQRDDSKTADEEETRSETEDRTDEDQSDEIQFPDTNISLSHLQPNR